MIKNFTLLTFLILVLYTTSKASHLLGGQISWECISSGVDEGKFQFKILLYRSCIGVNLGTGATLNNPLYASYGGPSTIVCSRILSQDMSETCYDGTLSLNCYSGSRRGDVVEEHVYLSTPVQLNGIPDSTGSDFWYSSCCRPATAYMKNLASGGTGYYLKATMYPYEDPLTNVPLSVGSNSTGPTCYDSSPELAETPSPTFCAKYSWKFNFGHRDDNLDSLDYRWITPSTSSSSNVSWATGYSQSQQLPGSSIDPLNVDAVLDSSNGKLSTYINSPIGGYFSTGIQVASYRNGQKIAEVNRDMVFIPINCNPTGNLRNSNTPIIEVKEANSPVFQPIFQDTFQIGSVIDLDIRMFDPDSLPTSPISLQSVRLEITGETMSSVPNSTQCGKNVPCAYLDSVNPAWNGSEFTDTTNMTVRFHWETECLELKRYAKAESDTMHTFVFKAKVIDNWCPIPQDSTIYFYITLLDTIRQNRQIDSLDAQSGGAFIRWKRSTARHFTNYKLFYKYKQTAPWIPLASYSNRNITSHFDALRRTDTNFVWYKVSSNDSGNCNTYEVRTSHLSLTLNSNNYPLVKWTPPYDRNRFVQGSYTIYRDDGSNKWQSFKVKNYFDGPLNNDTIIWDSYPTLNWWPKACYKVIGRDAEGYVSVSNSACIDIPNYIGIGQGNTALNMIQIFPNPVNSTLYISCDENMLVENLTIIDLKGRKIVEMKRPGTKSQIDLQGVEPGMYFIQVRDASGNTAFRKFIKK